MAGAKRNDCFEELSGHHSWTRPGALASTVLDYVQLYNKKKHSYDRKTIHMKGLGRVKVGCVFGS